jgi:acylpyruvate hydrolase
MRLYTFQHDGESRIGAEHDGTLVDLQMAHAALTASGKQFQLSGNGFPADMLALLRAGDAGMNFAKKALRFALEQESSRFMFPLAEVRLLAPVPRPGKILCSGVNYYSHKTENPKAVLPETPFFFSKLPSAVIGAGAAIIHPKATAQLDYEVELAVVIERACTARRRIR